MKKTFLLLFITILYAPQADGQTPQKIHDLKSLTDSDGTVHLFYRIFAEYESTEYYTNNIYHYNTHTGAVELFLEDFYDVRYGFSFSNRILDFRFLEKDPENFIYIINNDMHTWISRNDSTELMGGHLVSMDRLNVEGTDSGRVYVEMLGEIIIGRNGGREWPDVDAENFEEIPDSSILEFPLILLSPYDKTLMFGRKFFHLDGENAFLRSIDKGVTLEFISDTLLPNQIQFDPDSSTIYAFARTGSVEPSTNCSLEPCSYGLFVNQNSGEDGTWKLEKTIISEINSSTFPTIVAHTIESGRIYLWNGESVLVSDNYGEHFELLIETDEEITGFASSVSGEFYTTISTLYKLEGDHPVEVLSIPVSNEIFTNIPLQIELLQNYPNPFNPVTVIRYELPQNSEVRLEVFDMLGRRVALLADGLVAAGTHEIPFDASNLASGVYLYRLTAGQVVQTRQMVLVK